MKPRLRVLGSVGLVATSLACGSAGGHDATSNGAPPNTGLDAGESSQPDAEGIVGPRGEAGAEDSGEPSLDSGSGGDATADASPTGVPISGAVGQWVWNAVPGSSCANGNETGFAVSQGSGTDVLLYLEGGGFCYNEILCNDLKTASYFSSGYDGTTFQKVYGGNGAGPSTGAFDRTLTNNPFKDATLIYVPYCTADIVSGSTTQVLSSTETVHYAGRTNLELYMSMIAGAFPSPSHVTLAGTSAGGFGALINFDYVHQSFGNSTRVDLVTDSAPIFWNNGPTMPGGFPVWNTNAAIPADCTSCLSTNYAELYGFLSKKYPTSRFALVSHDQDLAISSGIYLEPYYPNFYLELGNFTSTTLRPLANWGYFVSQALDHGFLFDVVSEPSGVIYFPNLQQTSTEQVMKCNYVGNFCVPYWVSRSTVLADWLTSMVTDDPGWASTSDILLQ